MTINFDVEEDESLQVVSKRLDIVAARSVIEAYSDEIKKLADEMAGLSVIDEVSKAKAVAVGTTAARVLKDIEKKRDEIISEPKSFVKSVTNFTKNWETTLKAVVDDCRKKVAQYAAVIEQQRRIEEKKMREAAAALQKELDDKAAETGTVAPVVPEVFIPDKPVTTHTESGSQHTRKKWSFKVKEPYDDNIKLVPSNLIQLNEMAVRNAIKMGATEIPGLEIWEETIVVLRT